MDGGAWPFLVGGAICLVNSDNERDSSLLNSTPVGESPGNLQCFLEGSAALSRRRESNNRSVMPFDVLGRTRATLTESMGLVPAGDSRLTRQNLCRARDWGLKLSPMNEEFPVSVSH